MTEVRIFGEIGRDVTAKAVAEQLDGVTDDVIVRVNSGGGDVYEGIAVMNQLRACPGHVTVVIESLAASAASFIAVGGGDTVISRP
ncbi:ATP-dependent Clp protease proteolytic subunit, partial [Escherichia coli]|nr:ATP-dependent Clp protease proteolytic subunit [Escherichia coli]